MGLLRWVWRLVFWPFAAFIVFVWGFMLGLNGFWWLAVVAPVLVAWGLLRRDGQRAGFKRLLVGGVTALAALVTLYRGQTWERPQPPPGVDSVAMEYATDDMIAFGYYDLTYREDRFVVFPSSLEDPTIGLDIEMEPMSVPDAVLAVEAATATVVCDDDCDQTPLVVPVRTDTDWAGQVEAVRPGASKIDIVPVIEVQDLVYSQMTERAWYTVTVTATVAYAGEAAASIEREKISRTLHIYTGNAADKAARQALLQWEALDNAVNDVPGYTGIGVVGLFAGALAFWGYHATRTFPPPPLGVVTGVALVPYVPPTGQITLNPPPSGLRVGRVEKGSRWHAIGVLTDDVLVEVAGRPVSRVQGVIQQAAPHRRQGGVPITVWRRGDLLDLWLPLD